MVKSDPLKISKELEFDTFSEWLSLCEMGEERSLKMDELFIIGVV